MRAIVSTGLPRATEVDAVRHIIAVGVVLTTIVAMAQLVLPEFASERLAGRQGAWRGVALGALLALATLLRGGSPLAAAWLSPRLVDWSIALAGTIALAVMLLFAILFVRSVHTHRALLARFAALAASGQAWPLTQANGPPEGRDW